MDYWNIDAYRNLANEIVIVAAKDYETALKRLKRNPEDIYANGIKHDCECFFRNEISIYSELDGESIMRIIKERVEGRSKC